MNLARQGMDAVNRVGKMMVNRMLALFIFAVCLTASCHNPRVNGFIESETDVKPSHDCTKIDEASSIKLSGIVSITSEQIILFERDISAQAMLLERGIIDRNSRESKKIELIPCELSLKTYLFSYYDFYLYDRTRTNHEDFLVMVEGMFITFDREGTDQFLFNWIAIP